VSLDLVSHPSDRQADARLAFVNPDKPIEPGRSDHTDDPILETARVRLPQVLDEVVFADQAMRSLVPEHGEIRLFPLAGRTAQGRQSEALADHHVWADENSRILGEN